MVGVLQNIMEKNGLYQLDELIKVMCGIIQTQNELLSATISMLATTRQINVSLMIQFENLIELLGDEET